MQNTLYPALTNTHKPSQTLTNPHKPASKHPSYACMHHTHANPHERAWTTQKIRYERSTNPDLEPSYPFFRTLFSHHQIPHPRPQIRLHAAPYIALTNECEMHIDVQQKKSWYIISLHVIRWIMSMLLYKCLLCIDTSLASAMVL